MTEGIVSKLKEVIVKTIPKKVKIAQPSLFPNWESYLERFCNTGGVIEAVPLCSPNQISQPSISFFVEPSGESTLVGTFDRIEATQYVNGGCFFPASSLPQMNISAFINSIGSIMYEKGIIGHVTVDLVTFPNPQDPQGHPLFWAVDLSAQYTDNAVACLFFDILMEGQLDQLTGEYEVDCPDGTYDEIINESQQDKDGGFLNLRKEPRHFMFCNYLHHPGLATIQYKTFFHMCRLE